MNNANVYETKADEKGFFKILPKYIPIFPYYLEIIPRNGGAPIIYTPSAFAKKNKEYLSKNKINLVEGTKNNKSLKSNGPTSTQSGVTDITNQQNSKDSANKSLETEKKTKISSMLFLVFIIFVFFILIGITVFFIVKNKKNPPLS